MCGPWGKDTSIGQHFQHANNICLDPDPGPLVRGMDPDPDPDQDLDPSNIKQK